jgi:membrane protease YdiL (CAAX protease family)
MDSTPNAVPQSNRRPLFLAYTLIAYLISWAIEIPLALKAQGLTSADLPFAIHYLAAFGPFIAGLIMTWHEDGSAGWKNLASRTIKWRVEPVWWLVAVSPLLLFLLLAILIRLLQGTWLDFLMLNRFDFLPNLGAAAVLLWLATYGFGEEVGWRGYLLPRLQRDRSAWSATVILWIIWAIWHAPSFFYLHTVTGIGTLIGFLLGVLAGAIFLTWLYNSSGGSVLIVAVWHGLFDYVTACTQCKSGLIAATLSTLVMIWAVIVVAVFKPTKLSRQEKHVL